ncbi:V4R domain-containing protein [Archaeoglobus sp.]
MEIDESLIEEYTKKYRSIAEKEIKGEQKPRDKVKSYTQMDFLNPKRPFLSSLSKDDTIYVINFRLVRHANFEELLGQGTYAVWYRCGKTLGELAVDKGLIKSLDDFVKFVVEQRIGLVDLVKESNNKSRVHVYECISCSGIPNVGKTVCQFEGGLISGVLSKLTGSNVRVVETHCAGTGYSFCGFDVIFV